MPRQPGGGPRSPAEIADQIEDEIRKGLRAPHSRLPSRSALAEQLGVSPSTIYSAVDKLKRDRGMVYAKQGDGVFVAEPSSWRPVPPA
jgi:DNA-binding GntR family transcriptional regulator